MISPSLSLFWTIAHCLRSPAPTACRRLIKEAAGGLPSPLFSCCCNAVLPLRGEANRDNGGEYSSSNLLLRLSSRKPTCRSSSTVETRRGGCGSSRVTLSRGTVDSLFEARAVCLVYSARRRALSGDILSSILSGSCSLGDNSGVMTPSSSSSSTASRVYTDEPWKSFCGKLGAGGGGLISSHSSSFGSSLFSSSSTSASGESSGGISS